MALGGIPLTMYGVPVGMALINDDGTIVVSMESPCQFGKDLLVEFAAGQHDNLSISARSSSAPPPPIEEVVVVNE